MNVQNHWERVYREKDPAVDLSWYQSHPVKSLELIRATGIQRDAPLIDVGGGTSSLVDCLLNEGFTNISVLDISRGALQHARKRLGALARTVTWLEADITEFAPPQRYSLWHDRAVFHFLVEEKDRHNYIDALLRSLIPGGHLVLATFAEDGPIRCSGLPVVRYDRKSIIAELGSEFCLLSHHRESHFTPWKMEQKFNWFRFQRKPVATDPV